MRRRIHARGVTLFFFRREFLLRLLRVGGLVDIDLDGSLFDPYGKARNRKPVGIFYTKPRSHIEVPSVLRAENSEAIEFALTKRSTRVGTLILHSVNPVSHPKEADIDATDLHAEASVCGDVIHSSHLDKAHLLYS